MTSAKKAVAEKEVIGWREWVEIPGSKMRKIKAKVDTGARTSSIHAEDIRRFRRGSKRFIEFYVCPLPRSGRGRVKVTASFIEDRNVRSSTGESQKRPVVKMVLKIGHKIIHTEVTLAGRDRMAFPMLIGRQALKGNFIVDVSKSFHAKEKK